MAKGIGGAFLGISRSLVIFRLALSYWGDARAIQRANRRLPKDQAKEREAEIYRAGGARFRRQALRLGGLVIKVGQFLSARTDILPLAFTRELAVLQDQVPPAPFSQIQSVVEEQLGQPLHAVFSWFEEDPVAAASLGQVHRATLKETTEIVAVKVQRPMIDELAQVDLRALAVVMAALRRWTRPGRRLNTVRLFEEFRRRVYRELDYQTEAQHLQEFRRMFSGVLDVRVPLLYGQWTRRRLLVMEFIEGAKISDVERLATIPADPVSLARTLIHVYLRQIVQFGLVQMDPHPGNFLVDSSGRLVMLDFGMVARFNASDLTQFAHLIAGMLSQDPRGVVSAMEALGMVKPHANRPALIRAVQLMLQQMTGTPLEPGEPLDRAVADFQDFLYEEPLEFPAQYMFLGRAIGMLFGLVSALDPSVDWMVVLKSQALPILNQRRADVSPEWLRRVGKWIGEIVGDPAEMVFDTLGQQVIKSIQLAGRLPVRLDRVLQTVDDGQLVTRPELTPILRRMDRMADLLDGLTAMMAILLSFGIGLWLRRTGPWWAQDVAWGAVVFSGLWLVRARFRASHRIRRQSHLH